MPGDYAALRAELLKPDLAGLSDVAAAAQLETDTVTVLVPGSFLTEGGILRVLGPVEGDAALSAVEAAAQAGSSLLQRAVRILRDIAGGGLDFGDPPVRAMLDQLQAGGVLSADQVAGLKAHGQSTITRGEAIAGWGLPASAADVAHARSL